MKTDSRGAGWGEEGQFAPAASGGLGFTKQRREAPGIGKRRLTMGPKKTNKKKQKRRLEKKIPQVVILA